MPLLRPSLRGNSGGPSPARLSEETSEQVRERRGEFVTSCPPVRDPVTQSPPSAREWVAGGAAGRAVAHPGNCGRRGRARSPGRTCSGRSPGGSRTSRASRGCPRRTRSRLRQRRLVSDPAPRRGASCGRGVPSAGGGAGGGGGDHLIPGGPALQEALTAASPAPAPSEPARTLAGAAPRRPAHNCLRSPALCPKGGPLPPSPRQAPPPWLR